MCFTSAADYPHYTLFTTSASASSSSSPGQPELDRGRHRGYLGFLLTMIYSPIPFFLLPSLATAYTFRFTSVPTQCQDLSLATEGQGSPPYEVLIIPVGPSTAPNNVEVRKVIDQTFPNNGTTVSFPLRFPANSQFVAVVRLFTLIPSPFLFTPVPPRRSPTSPVLAPVERVFL